MPMYGLPDGLLAFAGAASGAHQGPFGALGGALQAFGRAEEAQANRSDRELQGMIDIARLNQEIQQAEQAQAQRQAQAEREAAYVQSLPPDQQALGAYAPEVLAKQQAEALFAGQMTEDQRVDNEFARERFAAEQGLAQQKFAFEQQKFAQEQAVAKANADKIDPKLIRGFQKDFDAGSKQFLTIKDNFNRFQRSLNMGTGSGDIAAIFNLQKILDPASVTREGEIHLLGKAGSLTDIAQQYYDNWSGEGALTKLQRADLLDAGRQQMLGSMDAYKDYVDEFSKDVSSMGMPVDMIVKDYLSDMDGLLAPNGNSSQAGGNHQGVTLGMIDRMSDDELAALPPHVIDRLEAELLAQQRSGGQSVSGSIPARPL